MNWDSLAENMVAEVFGLVTGVVITYCVVEVLLNRRATRQWNRIRFVAYAEMSRTTVRLYNALRTWQKTVASEREIWSFNGSEIFAPCDITCMSWKVLAEIEEKMSDDQQAEQRMGTDEKSGSAARLEELNELVTQTQINLDRYTIPLIEKLPVDLGEVLFGLHLALNNHVKLMNVGTLRPSRDNWLVANTLTRSMEACCGLLSYLRNHADVISHESWSNEATQVIQDIETRPKARRQAAAQRQFQSR